MRNRIMGILSVICLIGAACLLVDQIAVNGGSEKTDIPFGISMAVVMSGSMEPEISVDDLIVNMAQERYEIGDVVTFRSGTSLTTHRIVGESENGFVTKGDANNTEDAFLVTQENIIGKVVCSVPGIGLVLGYLKTPMGLMAIILVGFIVIEVPYLLENRKNR